MSATLKVDNDNYEQSLIDRNKAIDENFAVIEFHTDGTIITANEIFLNTLGYSLNEIQGKHHKIFCSDQLVNDLEYKQFWKNLYLGQSQIGQFQRFKKDGSSIWITASYTPIKDENGQTVKIIKFAQDNTHNKLINSEFEGKMNAISKAQAVIEFNLDGTIITANDNFLVTLGYSLNEIQGKHHRIFCEKEYGNSLEYSNFWKKLNSGEFESGEYKRIAKDGSEIWINASYNPIYNADGKVFKVVKFATDITKEKIKNADYESQLDAINKSQAVIEFNLDGTIIKANDNFLLTLGYSLDEIKGQHHRMFCESELVNSNEYNKFWQDLNNGEFKTGEFKRIGKGGKEIWINASYNPIYDVNGKVYKVVKYATDLTKEKVAYNNLVDTFDKGAKEISESSLQLIETATQMTKSADMTLTQSQSASAAVEQVNAGISTVGSSTEEMAASIREIANSSAEASTMSENAKASSENANKIINDLGNASEEIGNVIKVISSIAQQTNLLALNATIEAARAGDAGKGFAVVANEVKELAKQTAIATDDISNKINNVQNSTELAVTSIQDIGKMIESLSLIASQTAASVEEQAATTNEVSRVVQDSTAGVESITEVIKKVSNAANDNAQGANETQVAANNLKELSEKLQILVEEAKVS